MSKSLTKDTKKDISGFYYDFQKKNPLFRVTLHANTKPPKTKYEDWCDWVESSSDRVDTDFPYYRETGIDVDSANDKGVISSTHSKDVRYGAMPICSSVVNEDFNVAIANNWGEFVGSQAIQDVWNSTAKQLEPYASFAGKQLSKISEVAGQYKTDNTLTNSIRGFVSSAAKTGGDFLNGTGNVLSRSLVVQGTRFKYYGGTGIDFSNLGMRFTLFADYIEQLTATTSSGIEGSGKYSFMTPDDQLKPILPYAIGEYVPFADDNNKVEDLMNKWGLSDMKDAVNQFFGWQMPPGGFRADVQYIDTQQVGTLMLKIGPYYRLTNLVIQNIQLNYSKQIAKFAEVEGDSVKIKTCPLFCDVQITLTPASKYSNEMLKKFVMSRVNIDDPEKNSGVYYLEKSINDSLFNK